MLRVYCDSSTSESCFVVCRNGNEPEVHVHPYTTKQTNNAGEYQAVVRALTFLKENGLTDYTLFTDSKLVVNQVKNIDRCRAPNLQPYCEQVRHLLGADHIHYKDLHINWLPREENLAGIVLEKR